MKIKKFRNENGTVESKILDFDFSPEQGFSITYNDLAGGYLDIFFVWESGAAPTFNLQLLKNILFLISEKSEK